MKQEFRLGEVCHHISYGVTTSAVSLNEGPRLLRITDITENGVNWEKVPGCNISEKEKAKSKLLDGDIVIARTGGTVGKSFLIRNPPSAVCASYLLRLRPNRSLIIPDYLNLFLASDFYWSQLKAAAQGAAQPNVNSTTLSKLILPVPQITDQRRIVAQLKAQLSEVEKARKAAEAQLNDVTIIKSSLLDALFDFTKYGPVRIGKYAKLQSGYAFKSREFKTTGINLLRNVNVSPGKITWTETVCLSEGQKHLFNSYELKLGDVIISLDRPLISSGIKVAKICEKDIPSLLVQRVGRFILDEEMILPDYLYGFIKTNHFKKAISGHDQSLGVPHISPAQVESIEIPLPDTTTQKEIANKINEIIKVESELMKATLSIIADLSALSKRLISLSFEMN